MRLVNAAGTPEPLLATLRSDTRVKSVQIKALNANAGNVYLGYPADMVTATPAACVIMSPGEVWTFELSDDEFKAGDYIDLGRIYVDVDNNAEGVCFTYQPTGD